MLLTIDTEFCVGGAFQFPEAHEPIGAQNVLCTVAGKSEGLGFLLNEFKRHNFRATFFIEALQVAAFSDSPMREIVSLIAAQGHDMQLHLHPAWSYFENKDWKNQLRSEEPTDNLHGRSVSQLVSWMERGMDAFARWGLAPPIALRAGNHMVDRNVYRAMRKVGLGVASNVARGLFEPSEVALRVNSGNHRIEGVLEIPVLSYSSINAPFRSRLKSLTIAGTSVEEMTYLLETARATGVDTVCLATHCHEFVKGDKRTNLILNRLTQRRLQFLCRYLRDHNDRFEVTTISELSALAPQANPIKQEPIHVPAKLAILRMLENTLFGMHLKPAHWRKARAHHSYLGCLATLYTLLEPLQWLWMA